MKILTSTAVVLAFVAPAFAQDPVTMDVAQSEELGQFLTDAEGRPVYFFSTDTRASDDDEAQISCTSAECQEAWPLVTTSGDPEAGDGAEAALLGAMDYEDERVVTYKGLPLYHARDDDAEEPEAKRIEAFDGEFHLLAPAVRVEAEDIEAGETMFANACAQCHGQAGQGMASFPAIAGKNAEYISTMLMRYRAGETVGSNSALMKPVAADLSDEDIANLAAFVSRSLE